jgi:hypothetical protein
MEIQFMPGPGILGENVAAQVPTAYFGSTALYYEMHR